LDHRLIDAVAVTMIGSLAAHRCGGGDHDRAAGLRVR
jgi:hypothetical protein